MLVLLVAPDGRIHCKWTYKSLLLVDMLLFIQDASKRKAIDAAREDARLFRIASEVADQEERKRQWRVARGEVNLRP